MKIKTAWTSMTLAQKRIYVDFGAHDAGTDLGRIELWIGPRNWEKKRKDASGETTTLATHIPLSAKLAEDGTLTLEPGGGWFCGGSGRSKLARLRAIRKIIRRHSIHGIKDIDITLNAPKAVCAAFKAGDYDFFKRLADRT